VFIPSIRINSQRNQKPAFQNKNIMGIKYTDATIKQLAKAKAQSPHLVNRFFDGKTYDEILLKLKTEEKSRTLPYKNFDQWGRPTIIGKEVRKFFLKKLILDENATIGEFFTKEFENHIKTVKKIVKRVHKNFDGSYSQRT